MAAQNKGASGGTGKIITIQLTPEQSDLIHRESGGKLKISQFKLRADIDMREAVRQGGRNAGIAGGAVSAESIAPPPKGTWWC